MSDNSEIAKLALMVSKRDAEIKTLRDALKPFADYADPRDRMPGNIPITNGSSMARRQLTMNDCYRARATLTASLKAHAPLIAEERGTK